MIDAMRQALEALENHSGNYKLSKTECVRHNAAVESLRQAIAEAEKESALQEISDIGQALDGLAETSWEIEQEPVAWWNGQGYNFGADDEDFVYPETRQNHIKAGSHGYFWSIPLYTTPNMSTKPENIDTSAERVHEIDKSIHKTPDDLLRQSEREGWRYAKECEAEVKRLTDLNRQLVAAAKELGAADDVHEWDDAWAKMAKLMRQGEQNATSSQDGR